MAIVRTSRKLHKWLMLLIGAQLLIWAATGTYMVVMDIDYIHGDSLVVSQQRNSSAKSRAIVIDVSQVNITLHEIQHRYLNAEQISLKMLQGKVVYQVKLDKKWQLMSTQNGELLPSISKTQAIAIANSRYSGNGAVISAKLLSKPNGEVSPRILPAWQISFDDFAAPRLYISAQTGEIVTKRHSFWVLFDWLFRFHIMDYGGDEDSSNILLLVVALTSLLACITGVVLTYVSFIKVGGKSIKIPKSRKNKKLKFMPWIRFFHRWLSLLVFVQLLIWIGTGLYFNLMDHQKASGNQHRQSVVENTKQFANDNLFSLREVLQEYPSVEKISLIERLNQPFYLLTFEHGLYNHFLRKQLLINAKTGSVKNIDNELVQQMAQLSFKGTADVKSAQLLNKNEELPKQQNSLWKINFNNNVNTSVYIDSQNASIVGHVDDDKRLADFMFKLHFMDYNALGGKAGSFNNAQIILLALLTLLFSLTGGYWLLHLVKHKQFRY